MSLIRKNAFEEDDDDVMSAIGYRHFPNLDRFRLHTTSNVPIDENPAALALITPPKTNTNTSASSENSSHKQDTSEEMHMEALTTTDCQISSQHEHKTTAATKLFNERRQQRVSHFQSIHNNYTKRRYNHVESKVGQFIASIKAEDQKRRAAKLQRHRSFPPNLSAQNTMQSQEDFTVAEEHLKGYSTNDLYKLQRESHTNTMPTTACYGDHQNYNGMTCSTYSNSTQGGGASSSTSGAISNCTSRHESSDEAVSGADFIDKETYALLVAEKEQLEVRLEEKRQECALQKRNVDHIRIELMNCQDELKRFKANNRLTNLHKSIGYMGYRSMDYPYGGTSCFSIEKLNSTDVATKGTQTEPTATMSGLLTPKRLSTNENILRQRTNSNTSNQHLQLVSKRIYTHNIDDETNYKMKARQELHTPSPRASIKSSPSNSEFTYYDRRYAPVPTKNTSPEMDVFHPNLNLHSNQQRQPRRASTFRQRIVRLFGRCTRCDDPNQSFDAYGNSYIGNNIEMMRSPVPLSTDFN